MGDVSEKGLLLRLEKEKYRLLEQIEISEEEYKELIAYTKFRVTHLYMKVIPQPDIRLAVALVQIAIREYKEGRYWKCFLDVIDEDVSSAKLNYCGQIFSKTLKKYNLPEIIREEGRNNPYVENIKFHAFVTNYYMQGFFDFAYAYFENNLFRQLDDDIDNDIESLSGFMLRTLENNGDIITEDDNSPKAVKSYRLLKATRAALACADLNTIKKIFMPILQLIDSYYYDSKIPQIPNNRYEYYFIEWCNGNDREKSNSISRNTERRLASHRPYIFMDIQNSIAKLIIPAQKFRVEECDGYAEVRITVNGCIKTKQLEIYKSFGIYISEDIEIVLPEIFGQIDISIIALTERKSRVNGSKYRIFNSEWENISKFAKGHNYILIKKGINVEWKNPEDIIDSSNECNEWQYFSVSISDDSICYVENQPLSIIGEFSSEPVFEQLVEHFEVYDENERKLIVARKHPTISFVVSKNKYKGTVIEVNGKKYIVDSIETKTCFDWPDDKNKVAVTVVMDRVLPKEDGRYCLFIDIPGENNQILSEYILLKKLDCYCDKKIYTYDVYADLSVVSDENDIYAVNDEHKFIVLRNGIKTYRIPLNADISYVDIKIILEREYIIRLPLRLFQFGFSQAELSYNKPEYIWYADMRENIYIKMPDAAELGIYMGHNKKSIVFGEEIRAGLFRIDISEFLREIKNNKQQQWFYLNINYKSSYGSNSSLPAILRMPSIIPYFKLRSRNGLPYMEADIKGKASVFLKIEEYETGTVLAERLPIKSGRTEFPDLDSEKLYNFIPYMEECDEFGLLTEQTKMQPISEIGCVDFSNLVNCRLPIKKVIFEDKEIELSYDYFIDLRIKIDENIYEGTMYGLKLMADGRHGRYEKNEEGKLQKRKFGKIHIEIVPSDEEFVLSMQMFSYEDEKWMTPYYDKLNHELLQYNNSLLDRTDVYERVLFLDEYTTYFEINTNKLRRIRNVI